MTILFQTIIIAFLGFCLMFLALLLEKNYGKAKTRRCACQAAKTLMKEFETRKQAARKAAKYSPHKVNPHELPIVEDQ